MIQFEIPGPPVAWARARQSGKRHYTDPKVKAWKAEVGLRAAQARGMTVLADGALVVVLRFYLSPPPSWPRKRTQEALSGARHPTGKPDADNLGKGVLDALNGVLWRDDAQVVELTVSKRYAKQARTCVTVRPVTICATDYQDAIAPRRAT